MEESHPRIRHLLALALHLSLSLCLVESRFHVGSLLNESKEEKEVAQDGEYPSGT